MGRDKLCPYTPIKLGGKMADIAMSIINPAQEKLYLTDKLKRIFKD